MAENLSPDAILEEALRISDPEERAAYLDRVCGDGPEPRGEVESLLAAFRLAVPSGGAWSCPAAAISPK